MHLQKTVRTSGYTLETCYRTCHCLDTIVKSRVMEMQGTTAPTSLLVFKQSCLRLSYLRELSNV